MWKENLKTLESSRSHEGWNSIKTEVSKLGNEKTTLQCKNKIQNLKDLYKNAKHNNSKSGAAPKTSPFFDDFDETLSSRDVVNIPEKKEIGFRNPLNDETIKFEDASSPFSSATDRSISNEMYTTISSEVNDTNYEKSQNDDEDDFLQKSEVKEKVKKPNPEKREKAPQQCFQQQMIELQKAQLKAFEESEKRQQNFFEQMFEVQRRDDAAEKERDRHFFIEFAKFFQSKT